MKLSSANEVMLRINDVALRANGYAFGVIGTRKIRTTLVILADL